jgi:hypothetical protein
VSGIPITLLDTTATTNTVTVNISAHANRSVIFRPQVVLVGIDPPSVTTTVGDVFTERPDQAGPMLAHQKVSGTHALPNEFALAQNYPNPFNPTTTIKFDLPFDTKVTLKLYDVLGREVRTLVDREMPAGFHQATVEGSSLSSGVYIYKMEAGSFTQVRKLLLLK